MMYPPSEVGSNEKGTVSFPGEYLFDQEMFPDASSLTIYMFPLSWVATM